MSRYGRSRPHESAAAAAEAIRQLNHQTFSAGWAQGGPADMYDVLGSLASMASRLPQSCQHLSDYLAARHDAGRLRRTGAGEARESVTAAISQLATAVAAAAELAGALRRTQSAINDLYEEDGDGS